MPTQQQHEQEQPLRTLQVPMVVPLALQTSVLFMLTMLLLLGCTTAAASLGLRVCVLLAAQGPVGTLVYAATWPTRQQQA